MNRPVTVAEATAANCYDEAVTRVQLRTVQLHGTAGTRRYGIGG